MALFQVDSINAEGRFDANAVVIEVQSGGVFMRMVVAPHQANQMIRDLQDAMVKLGHTTFVGGVES
jgi:phage head maturation protease